jgi:hypothetical protein
VQPPTSPAPPGNQWIRARFGWVSSSSTRQGLPNKKRAMAAAIARLE